MSKKTKWVTTNIRFPEDMYIQLKREASLKNISLAKLVRQKIGAKTVHTNNKSVEQLMKEFEEIAKENDRQNPGVSFSEKLIEMRYEQ